MSSRYASSGATLIELMVGLLVLVILASLAAPSLQAFMASGQLTAAANDLMGSLLQARSQAIRLGQRVTVCRSFDGQTCDASAARGWETGWITFTDPDRSSGTALVSPTDTLTARSPGLADSIRLQGNQPLRDYVSFAPDGSGKLMNGAAQLGRLQVCSRSTALEDNRRARDLILSMTGRVVAEAPSRGVASTCPAP